MTVPVNPSTPPGSPCSLVPPHTVVLYRTLKGEAEIVKSGDVDPPVNVMATSTTLLLLGRVMELTVLAGLSAKSIRRG